MKLSNRGNGLGYILFFSLSFLFITKIDAAQQLQAPKVILRLSDGTGLPLKQRELSRMGFVKNLLETQDDTQEANEPLEIPLAGHLVTPEAGTLLMRLMENVLSDESYEKIPEIEASNSQVA